MTQYILRIIWVSIFLLISAYEATAQTSPSQTAKEGIAFYQQKNYARALPLLKKASLDGDVDGKYYLGLMYFYGQGMGESKPKGISLYRQAAEAGHMGAANELGLAFENGSGGLPKNMEKAVKWYRIAAEGGNKNALRNMGYVYMNGLTVPVSYEKANMWYRKAAEQGHAGAATSLGLSYEKGRGVTKDLKTAVSWYLKGAEGGDKYGMSNYAYSRYKGLDGTQSYAEAYEWFLKAANERNHDRAQYNLGVLYEKGHGVAQSYTEALKWYEKAAAQGYKGAGDKVAGLKPKVKPKSTRKPKPAEPVTVAYSSRPSDATLPLSSIPQNEFDPTILLTIKFGHVSQAADTSFESCSKYFHKDSKMCFSSAWLQENGHGYAKPRFKGAKAHYKRACRQRSDAACRAYQRLVYEHRVQGEDLYLASDHMSRLCKSGDFKACDNYFLATVQTGYSVPASRINVTAEYYASWCNNTPKNYDACFNLAFMMKDNWFGMENTALARQLFQDTCNKGGIDDGCKNVATLDAQKRQRDFEYRLANENRGIGGFLEDLGKGIALANKMGAASQSRVSSDDLPSLSPSAKSSVTSQDWRNFNNAVRATNNIGTGYNSNCPASNPYC